MFVPESLPKIANIKAWLHENQIYFTTIIAVAFAFSSAALSFASFSLQKTEEALKRREFMPQFVVTSGFATSTDGKIQEVIQITNEGRAANAFTAMLLPEFEFSPSWRNVRNPVVLPVKDYAQPPTFNFDPREETVFGPNVVKFVRSESGAFQKVLKLQSEFATSSKERGLNDAAFYFQTFLLLSYQDIFGERHSELYLVYGDYSYLIVDRKKRDEVIENYWDSYPNSISLNDDINIIFDKAITESERSRFYEMLDAWHDRKSKQEGRRRLFQSTGCTDENYFQCHPSPPG